MTDQQLQHHHDHDSIIAPKNVAPKIIDARAISRDFFSATVGSICCCYVGQPFDTGMKSDKMQRNQ